MPDSDLTQVGIFMGTPGYSPPEAIREGRYTPQADVFAWGAVFYEVLSGRIPYEGPDTKTTNGYVVQGNAPSPARHDASIPEPLATVTMTALQPSDRSRFKDASEAEQALREAWDRCLTQGLVHPAVLAMEEQPHDKVSSRMHEPRNLPGRPPVMIPVAPISSSDSNELTAVDDHMHGKPLTIESKKPPRVSDDDPTMLQVRVDDLRAKGDATTRGVAPERTERSSGKNKAPVLDSPGPKLGSGGHARLGDAAPTENDESKIDTSMIERSDTRPESRMPLILGLAIAALIAVIVSLFIGGVL
jgi:serine/threonine protein kinase